MISIEIKNIIYKSFTFEGINKIGNNILLEKKSINNAQFRNTDILELLKYFGTKILEILPQNFKANSSNMNFDNIDALFNIFIELYNKIGYIYSDTDICDKTNSNILVTTESILNLSEKIIRTYLFYELYSLLASKSFESKKAENIMNILSPYNKYTSLSINLLLSTINTEFKKYDSRIYLDNLSDFEKTYNLDTLTKFNIVSNDFFSLCLYILIDNLSLIQYTSNPKFIKCINCKKITIRKNTSQKYCPDCKCNATYMNRTKGTKEQIIKDLIYYKSKIHLENDILKKQLEIYTSLQNPGKSRELYKTRKKDLLEFLNIIKEQYDKEYKHENKINI